MHQATTYIYIYTCTVSDRWAEGWAPTSGDKGFSTHEAFASGSKSFQARPFAHFGQA